MNYRTRTYRISAETPDRDIKDEVLQAVRYTKERNIDYRILAENGSIVLIAVILTLEVKKLIEFFDQKNIEATITKEYDNTI